MLVADKVLSLIYRELDFRATPQHELRNLCDSLELIDLMLVLGAEFHFNFEEVKELKTVGDLIQWIEVNRNPAGGVLV